ncbi:hypothetical protein GCM10011360_42010 [Primorskyibacter flagellatus]|uniref:Uncharacterized protein n=1 Tax=Primorskyibacter flagellatus TaxID=1387277 RepID=A0A917AFV8_9RHOB|nr:hypothetical protein [Primorskyibacter flagellatus]GGE50527.1 hypothetical protein GCM10011360_42010 [Primorskyibacter flagellatus]
MQRPDKLAYFLEADQLAGVFAEWPDEMNVVLCLDESGGCEVIAYHQAEGRGVLRKVASVMERPLGKFIVVPEIKGYPTRKVLFSEEQKMLSLVAGLYDLPETATDYAINYRFALEQGLDPETMKRPESRKTAEVITPAFRHREVGEITAAATTFATAAPLVATRAANGARPASVRPRLRLSMGGLKKPKPEPVVVAAPAPEPKFPTGYVPADGLGRDECHFFDGQLFEQDDCIRIVISRDRMSVRTVPVRVNEVLFRDDFSRFMIPREVLSGWRPGDAAVLDVPVEQFPASLVRRFQQFARHGEVTVTAKGVFIAPGGKIEGWKPLEAKPKPLLRRVVTPLRAAMLALIGVGAITGALLSTAQENGQQLGADWSIFGGSEATAEDPEVTRRLGTPLDLLGTMTREAAQGASR